MDGVIRKVDARVQSEGFPLVHGHGKEWIMKQLLFGDNTTLVVASEKGLSHSVNRPEEVGDLV